jgi:hypothetical protein
MIILYYAVVPFLVVLRLFAHVAWFVWPICVFTDFAVSQSARYQDAGWLSSRWVPRILHSLAMGSFVAVNVVEYVWLRIIRIHYHGGLETYVFGALAFYVSLKLSRAFDYQPQEKLSNIKLHTYQSLLLPGLAALIIILAGFNSITSSLIRIINIEFGVMIIVPVIILLAMRHLSRCRIGTLHIVWYGSFAGAFFIMLVICWVAAGFVFLGFLPWGDTNDNLWGIVATGFVSFAIMLLAALLRREVLERERSVSPAHPVTPDTQVATDGSPGKT